MGERDQATSRGITRAVGGYRDIIKQWSGQEEKLEEFPELWAVLSSWPAKGGLNVVNNMKELARLLKSPATILGAHYRLWVRIDLEHGVEMISISAPAGRPEKFFDVGDMIKVADLIKTYCPRGQIRRILVVEDGDKVTVYRNQQRRESLNDAVIAAAVKVDIAHDEYPNAYIVRLNGRLVWDGEGEDSTIATIVRIVNRFRGNIALDLSNVGKIDSAGLGAIVGLYTSVTRRGDRFVLLNPSARFQEQLKVMQLDSVLKAYYDELEAVNSFNIVFE